MSFRNGGLDRRLDSMESPAATRRRIARRLLHADGDLIQLEKKALLAMLVLVGVALTSVIGLMIDGTHGALSVVLPVLFLALVLGVLLQLNYAGDDERR